MPKRSRTPRQTDENTRAFDVVRIATDENTDAPATNGKPPVAKKNPAAVALGRLGGLKGGKARAAKLSKKRRSDIARKAAQKRWESKESV